jgi:hypothetical protein
MSSTVVAGAFFFEGTVTGAAYLNMLQESTVTVRQMCGDEDTWYQQDGAPPHYHRDVRAYLDNISPDRQIGGRGSVEYPPRSPNLTPPDFSLWSDLKDAVYSTKPAPAKKLNGLAQPSQQQIWWPLFGQLLTAVNCATKLTVVILNTCTRFTNTLSANAHVYNSLVY